jgi:hypothetical protein
MPFWRLLEIREAVIYRHTVEWLMGEPVRYVTQEPRG